MTDEQKAVIRRAADWLEAHPDRHTRGALARTDTGHAVDPLDKQAFCFCALGRVAYEAGVTMRDSLSYQVIYNAVGMSAEQSRDIWVTNDRRGPVVSLLRTLSA